MSDVLPQSNQEALPAGPAAPRKDQAAIERLRKRMEGYREMQSSRMPQYENHVKPAYDNYIAPTMQHADIIVPRGGENEVGGPRRALGHCRDLA